MVSFVAIDQFKKNLEILTFILINYERRPDRSELIYSWNLFIIFTKILL